MELINPTPQLLGRRDLSRASRAAETAAADWDDDSPRQEIDALEVFELVRDIRDPEHPHTLEELGVVDDRSISVDDRRGRVHVSFRPTVAHCSMATLIGLCLRVRLLRALPRRFKVDIIVEPDSHESEEAVNKQLADKERVAAALENPHLLSTVESCLGGA